MFSRVKVPNGKDGEYCYFAYDEQGEKDIVKILTENGQDWERLTLQDLKEEIGTPQTKTIEDAVKNRAESVYEHAKKIIDFDRAIAWYWSSGRTDYDYTKAERSRRRRETLNTKAQELGFASLSEMLTKWKNDKIEIVVRK